MQGKASRRDGCEEPRHAVAGIWVLLLAMLPAAAVAQVEHRFRIQGTWSNPTDELRDPDEGGDVVIEAEDAFGARLGYELLFRHHWGVELAAGTTRHDVAVEAGGFRVDLARLRVTPITASLLYHFTPQSKADFYLGGGAAYVDYGDFEFTGANLDDPDRTSFAVDADLTYTLQAGVDVRLNDRWGLGGNLQWIDTDAEIEDEALPISPLVVGAGVTLHF